MKQAIELVKGLKYKLRMFGVPLEGTMKNGTLQQPANMYCDNEAVYKNITIPSSVLSKKMHGISYHFLEKLLHQVRVGLQKKSH